jgi:hypothetical protein
VLGRDELDAVLGHADGLDLVAHAEPIEERRVFFLALVGAILTGMNAAKSGNLIATGIVIAVAAALYRRRSVQ